MYSMSSTSNNSNSRGSTTNRQNNRSYKHAKYGYLTGTTSNIRSATQNQLSTGQVQVFENFINAVLKSKNAKFRFKLLDDKFLSTKPFLLNPMIRERYESHQTVRDYLLNLVPWDKPNRRYFTSAFCMYTKDDFDEKFVHEPLTMLLVGSTQLTIKGKKKSCLQILFGFDNPNKIKGSFSNAPKVNVQGKGESMNYHLRLCLLTWGKIEQYDYVTTEAINWASQRQSEKLGFQILKPDIMYPNNYNNAFNAGMVKAFIIKHGLQNKLKSLTDSDIQKYSKRDLNKNKYFIPVNPRMYYKYQAFLMKYKNDPKLKPLFLSNLRKDPSYLAGSYGAAYGGTSTLDVNQYNKKFGYVPYRYNAHFTHYYDLKAHFMLDNIYYKEWKSFVNKISNANNAFSQASYGTNTMNISDIFTRLDLNSKVSRRTRLANKASKLKQVIKKTIGKKKSMKKATKQALKSNIKSNNMSQVSATNNYRNTANSS